jgi:hypothetical protein
LNGEYGGGFGGFVLGNMIPFVSTTAVQLTWPSGFIVTSGTEQPALIFTGMVTALNGVVLQEKPVVMTRMQRKPNPTISFLLIETSNDGPGLVALRTVARRADLST